MQKIKFRIWDCEEKQWVDTRVWYNINSFFTFNERGELEWFRNTDRFICCQFTGQQDKNDKEIFEGDILQRHYKGRDVVKRNENCGGFEPFVDRLETEYYGGELEKKWIEVIGNIYDNPEIKI